MRETRRADAQLLRGVDPQHATLSGQCGRDEEQAWPQAPPELAARRLTHHERISTTGEDREAQRGRTRPEPTDDLSPDLNKCALTSVSRCSQLKRWASGSDRRFRDELVCHRAEFLYGASSSRESFKRATSRGAACGLCDAAVQGTAQREADPRRRSVRLELGRRALGLPVQDLKPVARRRLESQASHPVRSR
jgi:hypothetical protein